jgi:hypothetical protein
MPVKQVANNIEIAIDANGNVVSVRDTNPPDELDQRRPVARLLINKTQLASVLPLAIGQLMRMSKLVSIDGRDGGDA